MILISEDIVYNYLFVEGVKVDRSDNAWGGKALIYEEKDISLEVGLLAHTQRLYQSYNDHRGEGASFGFNLIYATIRGKHPRITYRIKHLQTGRRLKMFELASDVDSMLRKFYREDEKLFNTIVRVLKSDKNFDSRVDYLEKKGFE